MKPIVSTPLLIANLSLAASTATAQLADYSFDAYTDNTVRLFMDAGQTTPAPVGTTVWFVADLSGNGFPSGSVTTAQVQDIISNTGDDRLFYTDQVDGRLPGDQPGNYRHISVSPVPGNFATARIGLVLWNDVNHNSNIGDAGDTFGYFDFGVVTPPAAGFGNAIYLINGDVHADANLVVPVPESASAAMAIGSLCLAGALIRRVTLKASAARL